MTLGTVQPPALVKVAKRPILVVDDEPEILFSLRGLLRREFDVHTACGGAEAIQVLHDHPVHVVMTDQRMPQMTGVEFLRRVKDEHPEAIRLIFTGYADINAVIDAINQGSVFRYIAKPWNPDDLVEVIRDAGKQYDRLAARNRLLADLHTHEQQCLAFEEDLRAGQAGTLTAAAAEQMESLYAEGRGLLARLGDALAAPPPVPPAGTPSE